MTDRTDAKGIPLCDRPADMQVIYKPDGEHEKRMTYCGEHAGPFIRALMVRQQEFTSSPLTPPESCVAWKDV
jgi:hypothetical protein